MDHSSPGATYEVKMAGNVRYRVRTPEAGQFISFTSAPATPPFASPPHSLTSHSSRSPQHLVTLHDYRKQQLTPSPPAVEAASGRRVKKRRAVVNLATVSRITSPPTTPHQIGVSDSPEILVGDSYPLLSDIGESFPLLSERCAHTNSGGIGRTARTSPSFRQRLRTATTAFQRSHDQVRFDFSSSGILDRTDCKSRSLRDLSKSSGLIQRPSKNLTSNASSQSRSENSSSSNLLSTTDDHTSSSVFSLSRFPQPPRFTQNDPTFLTSNPALTDLAPDLASSSTATVLHYRGASFDVVNPHKSLYLSNIETPADGDADLIDYFQGVQSGGTPFTQVNMSSPFQMQDNASTTSVDKPMRQRALYNDLPSAYASIAVRNKQGSLHTSPSSESLQHQLPVPPVPALLTAKAATFDEPASETPLKSTQPVSDSEQHLAPPNFFRRVSKALLRKKELPVNAVKEGPADDYESRKQVPDAHQPAHAGYVSVINSLDAGTQVQTELRGGARSRDDRGYLPHEDSEQESFDVESLYTTRTGGEDSYSLYPEGDDKRRSVPFGVRTGQMDYSSELQVDPYYHLNRASVEGVEILSGEQTAGSFQEGLNAAENRQDSTIGSILDHYQWGDQSHDAVPVLARKEKPEGTNNDVSIGHLLESSNEPPRSSGLSQFDFGLDEADKDSNPGRVPGSKGHRLFPATAGAPPTMLAPLQPRMDHLPPGSPFGGRDNSGTSEIFSHVSSYGDTKNLLMSSHQFQNVGHLRGAYASSPRLTNEGETVSQRFTNEGENAPPSLRNARNGDSAPPKRDGLELPKVSPAGPVNVKREPLSLTGTLGQELKRVSAVSSATRLSGNVLLLDKETLAKEVIDTESKPLQSALKSRVVLSSSDASGELNTAQQETLNVQTDVGPTRGKNDRSGLPRMWKSPSFIITDSEDKASEDEDKASEDEDRASEDDWVTVVGSSRPDLGRAGEANDSFPSILRHGGLRHILSGSLASGRNENEHEHALTENIELATLSSVRHARPVQASPPKSLQCSISSGSVGDEAASADEPQGAYDEGMLSTEPHDEIQYEPSNNLPTTTGTQPEPELEALPQVMSAHGAQSPVWFAGASSSTPKVVASSPENSFNKLSVLGPKGNITGTPLGTGMREVGSSPAISPATPSNESRRSLPLTRGQPALAAYDSSKYGITTELDRGKGRVNRIQESAPVTTGGPVQEDFAARQASMFRSSVRPREPAVKRPSVPGQTQLIQMALTSDETLTLRGTPASNETPTSRGPHPSHETLQFNYGVTASPVSTRFSHFVNQAHGSRASILPRSALDCYPHLARRKSTISPGMKKQEEQLSWLVFAICCVVPPLLICYSVGWLDCAMVQLTHGQIEQFGLKQKKVALIAGTVACFVVTLIGMALLVGAYLASAN